MKSIWFFLTIIILIPYSTYEIYALQQTAGPITIEIKPGESKTFQWGLASDSDVATSVELRAEGRGSEFLSFTKQISIEPRQFTSSEFTVIIPADHPGGVDLTPSLYATEFGEQGGSTVINIQMKKIPTIKITTNENPEFRSNTAYDYPETNQNESSNEAKIEQPKIPKDQEQTTIVNPSVPEIKSTESKFKGGGCLIATATYGSELAPQVQQLRELRDNSLLQTESGTTFMTGFNQIYYSFSPTIADWERENPVFKEIVKITLTPMISSLSILNYVDMTSEFSVLANGIFLIMLNLGMYFVAPVIAIHKIRQRF